VSGLSLLLWVGSQRFFVPCRRVKEVIPSVQLDPEPRAPAWFAGLFNYRGAITPVIDLCRLVSDAGCINRLSSRIVVFEHAAPDGTARPAGLLAERVTDTHLLDVQHRSAASGEAAEYFSEVVLDAQGMLHAIDLDRLVRRTLQTLADPAPPRELPQHVAREHREPA
jgi:chemotaxis-related protein WspB